MSYLAKATNLKKKFCIHKFQQKYPQGKKHPLLVCSRCYKIKTPNVQNQSLEQSVKKSTASAAVLALKQSNTLSEKVKQYKETTNWNTIRYQGFKLPATRSKYSWCGVLILLGCLNYKLHQTLGKGKRLYVKQYVRSCYRASCELCFTKWIAREADRASKRIEKYSKIHPGKRPIHLMLLPPPSQRDLPYKLLKERMMMILKMAEFEGGAVVFHPFKLRTDWYVSPHFHIVGFGNKAKLRNVYGKYGWYVKSKGERKTLFGTFWYLLSHSGVRDKKHSIVWIGNLSYRKLKVEKEKKDMCCPVCKDKFVPICYDGVHQIVTKDKPYEGLVDWDKNWHQV